MSESRIKGTYIAQLNPFFVDDKGNLIPFAMTAVLKFDGMGNVIGKLIRRQPGDPLPPSDVTGTYSLAKNVQLGVFEGEMQLVVGGNSDVTIYIVRRNADEVHMNHVNVIRAGVQQLNVANGILRREHHHWWEWRSWWP